MTTDVAEVQGSHVILMKNSMTHLVRPETAATISEHLVQQDAHSFIRIKELGVVINSAEVAGVYTPQQHEELLRIAAGEFQCAYGVWHKKRQSCDCKYELARERDRKIEAIRRQKEHAPLTPEQRLEAGRRAREIIDEMRHKIGGVGGKPFLKRSALNAYEKKHGSPYIIPPGYEIIEDV